MFLLCKGCKLLSVVMARKIPERLLPLLLSNPGRPIWWMAHCGTSFNVLYILTFRPFHVFCRNVRGKTSITITCLELLRLLRFRFCCLGVIVVLFLFNIWLSMPGLISLKRNFYGHEVNSFIAYILELSKYRQKSKCGIFCGSRGFFGYL